MPLAFYVKGAHELVKTVTQQALQSAAKTGFDVLNQKKIFKTSIKGSRFTSHS